MASPELFHVERQDLGLLYLTNLRDMNFHNTGRKFTTGISFILLILISFTSCKTPQDVTYFQDVTDAIITIPNTGELKIRPNDRLNIIVKTMDPNLTALFNMAVVTDRIGENTIYNPNGGTFRNNTSTSTGIPKYIVSPEGTIDFPVLGEIKVAGMTRSELAGFIKGELMGRDLAKDPVVSVEFMNMGVSMLGEVVRPGMYDLNQDQVSIIEAIAMAGDLTLHGKRENIIVMRESDGEVKTYRVDLTNYKELTESPVYFLQQGDIVYVEPTDLKKRERTTNGNYVYTTAFWISLASLVTSMVTTIGVFVLR